MWRFPGGGGFPVCIFWAGTNARFWCIRKYWQKMNRFARLQSPPKRHFPKSRRRNCKRSRMILSPPAEAKRPPNERRRGRKKRIRQLAEAEGLKRYEKNIPMPTARGTRNKIKN